MTTTPPSTTQLPSGWTPIAGDVLAIAKEHALSALRSPKLPTHQRLADHSMAQDFAGALFTGLMPNEWSDVTAADLHAASLMGARTGPHATRRVLTGPEGRWVVTELGKLPDTSLTLADASTLEAMYDFHLAVAHAVSHPEQPTSEASRTATVLSARKRPELFPVWDEVVAAALGLRYQVDPRPAWLVLRSLLQDSEVRRRVFELQDAGAAIGSGDSSELDQSELRILDTVLRTRSGAPDERLSHLPD